MPDGGSHDDRHSSATRGMLILLRTKQPTVFTILATHATWIVIAITHILSFLRIALGCTKLRQCSSSGALNAQKQAATETSDKTETTTDLIRQCDHPFGEDQQYTASPTPTALDFASPSPCRSSASRVAHLLSHPTIGHTYQGNLRL